MLPSKDFKYTIHFDCNRAGGVDWWFNEKECRPIDKQRWYIFITKDDLNDLINSLQELKLKIQNEK